MKKGRRIVIWVVGSLAALVLIAAAFVFALFRTFYPSPPKPNFPAAQDAATAQRQDFDYFKNYFDLNRTYTLAARSQAIQLLAQYREQSGTLSPAQFDLAIARMAALADNGHSRVHPGPLSRRHTRIPCRLYRFADGYYVIRARPACAGLLGAKVLQIDGHAIGAVADAMFSYFGGPRNHYDQYASVFFLESPELLQAAGMASAANRVTLHVSMRDGSERDAEIVADAANPDAPRVFGSEFLSPEGVEKESADWRPLLAEDAKLPVFLRNLSVPFQAEYWADKGIYYAQYRSNEDEPGYPIGEFNERVRADIVANRPRAIVLDLRLNQGGNFTTTASLMKHLTTLTQSVEHVYVLTSAWTFSAGNVSLALAKEHGGDKVITVGEPVGDRIRTWAEGGSLDLPNSKLSVGFATGLHDYSQSCRGTPGCFWVMYLFPMHVSTLLPDIRVPYSFDDYVNLRDPILERTLELARTSR
jgi:hypothetical protein